MFRNNFFSSLPTHVLSDLQDGVFPEQSVCSIHSARCESFIYCIAECKNFLNMSKSTQKFAIVFITYIEHYFNGKFNFILCNQKNLVYTTGYKMTLNHNLPKVDLFYLMKIFFYN